MTEDTQGSEAVEGPRGHEFDESQGDQERNPPVDIGSTSGAPGVSGSQATDFRPGMAEPTPLADDPSGADE